MEIKGTPPVSSQTGDYNGHSPAYSRHSVKVWCVCVCVGGNEKLFSDAISEGLQCYQRQVTSSDGAGIKGTFTDSSIFLSVG